MKPAQPLKMLPSSTLTGVRTVLAALERRQQVPLEAGERQWHRWHALPRARTDTRCPTCRDQPQRHTAARTVLAALEHCQQVPFKAGEWLWASWLVQPQARQHQSPTSQTLDPHRARTVLAAPERG